MLFDHSIGMIVVSSIALHNITANHWHTKRNKKLQFTFHSNTQNDGTINKKIKQKIIQIKIRMKEAQWNGFYYIFIS